MCSGSARCARCKLRSKYLLNQLNASEQVHSEINERPDNALLFVFFLLQHKHVVVEELLQFLVGEVDAKLLESVVLREFINTEKGYFDNIYMST